MAVAQRSCIGVATIAGAVAGRVGEALPGRRWSDDHALPNADADVEPRHRHARRIHAASNTFTASTLTPARRRSTRIVAADGRRSGRPRRCASRWTNCAVSNRRRCSPRCLHFQSTRRRLDQHHAMDRREPATSIAAAWPAAVRDASPDYLRRRVLRVDLRSTTIRTDERVMLAYEWDGVPLLVEHGYPVAAFRPRSVRDEAAEMDRRHRRHRDSGSPATGWPAAGSATDAWRHRRRSTS